MERPAGLSALWRCREHPAGAEQAAHVLAQGLPQAFHGHDEDVHARDEAPAAGLDLRDLLGHDGPQGRVRDAVVEGTGLPVPDRVVHAAPHPRTATTPKAETVAATPPTTNNLIEPKAILGPDIEELDNRDEFLGAMVGMIERRGWRCDSISSARKSCFPRADSRSDVTSSATSTSSRTAAGTGPSRSSEVRR